MNKDILAAFIVGDEAITLFSIEPFDSTGH
jgi:hypothetical protein